MWPSTAGIWADCPLPPSYVHQSSSAGKTVLAPWHGGPSKRAKHVSRCESVYGDLPSANFSSFLSFLFLSLPGILVDIKPILWSSRTCSCGIMYCLFET